MPEESSGERHKGEENEKAFRKLEAREKRTTVANPIRTQKIDMDTFSAGEDSSGSAFMDDFRRKYFRNGSTHSAALPHKIAADSHSGFIRSSNEDSYAYYVNQENGQTLMAVADGIGGHENGDIASYLTMKMLISSWREFQCRGELESEAVREFLRNELEEINSAIYQINAEYNVAYPMGTTVAAAAVLQDSIVTAHAGDSRVYRLREKKLKRLTEDHSFVAELIRSGAITEEDALTHPYAHVISKSIGPVPALEPEINVYDYQTGDKVLVCTDGLMLHLSDDEIRSILITASNPAAATKKMLNTTLRKGGGDNVTIVCLSD